VEGYGGGGGGGGRHWRQRLRATTMTTASLPLPSIPPLPDPVEGRGVGGGAGGGRWRRRLRATTTMPTALLPLPLTPPLPDLAEGRGVGGAHGLAAPTIPFQIRPRREGGGGSGHPMQWRSSLVTRTSFFLKFRCSLLLTCCGFESNTFVSWMRICDLKPYGGVGLEGNFFLTSRVFLQARLLALGSACEDPNCCM
jgi:hypothetical protein